MKKILLVDDEPDLVEVVTFRLKSAGYDVITALDGKTAFDIINDTRPDLILLDLLLPVISGDEVCRKIKSDDRLKDIPVILFTASAILVPERAEKLGADDYLIKPFEPEDLLGKIKKFIG